MVLKPYKYGNNWVFDDEATGLFREAFVNGVGEILEILLPAQNIPIEVATEGFNMLFGATPFPGYQVHGVWDSEEYGGNWYKVQEMYNADKLPVVNGIGMMGWLCPALLKYMNPAPQDLYVGVSPARLVNKA